MNQQETSRLISLMKASYPASFSKATPEEMRDKILVWQSLFREYPFEPVERALREYILTNDTAFAPSPGQLNAIITKWVSDRDPERISKYEAWDMVLEAMRESPTYHPEVFDNLPEPVKRCVGNRGSLIQWSLMSLDQLDFIKHDFLTRYQESLDRDERQYALPENIILKLGVIQQQLTENTQMKSSKGEYR